MHPIPQNIPKVIKPICPAIFNGGGGGYIASPMSVRLSHTMARSGGICATLTHF